MRLRRKNKMIKVYAINPAVISESFLTPFSPKYSLIKSVVIKTIGQGKIPMLIGTPKTSINLPPVNSATIAFVIKIPARIT